MKLICLTGTQATGKSYVGRKIANELDIPLMDNLGYRRYLYLTQLFITYRYMIRLLVLRSKRINAAVVVGTYLDQFGYSMAYQDRRTATLLQRLTKRQLKNTNNMFIYLPPTPELAERTATDAKWRPDTQMALHVDRVIHRGLRRYCPPGKSLDLPSSLETRREVLPDTIKFLKGWLNATERT